MYINLSPVPDNEESRLRILDQTGIMYSAEEEEFQELVKAVAEICEVKMALVTIIHSNVQWFKAKVGLDGTETPREISFCQHTIMSHQLMEINDTLHDERFKENPFVTDAPNIRFYAGQPIMVEGHALGALCVIDDKPRALNEEQREALKHFGIRVAELIELRKAKLAIANS